MDQRSSKSITNQQLPVYKIPDGFIVYLFLCIPLYTYKTLFTNRHCTIFKFIAKYDMHIRYYSHIGITQCLSSLQNMILQHTMVPSTDKKSNFMLTGLARTFLILIYQGVHHCTQV